MLTGAAQGNAWLRVELDVNKRIGVVKVYPRMDSHKQSSIESAVVSAKP